MRTGAKNVRARPFSRARGHFCILKRILEIGHGKTEYSLTIYLTTKKTLERAHAHRSPNSTARPFSRTRSCFHIVTCIVEIKHGKTKYSMSIYLTTTTKIQTYQGVTMRTRAENIHVPLFSLSHSHFLIVKSILEACHKQKKYSSTIYVCI